MRIEEVVRLEVFGDASELVLTQDQGALGGFSRLDVPDQVLTHFIDRRADESDLVVFMAASPIDSKRGFQLRQVQRKCVLGEGVKGPPHHQIKQNKQESRDEEGLDGFRSEYESRLVRESIRQTLWASLHDQGPKRLPSVAMLKNQRVLAPHPVRRVRGSQALHNGAIAPHFNVVDGRQLQNAGQLDAQHVQVERPQTGLDARHSAVPYFGKPLLDLRQLPPVFVVQLSCRPN